MFRLQMLAVAGLLLFTGSAVVTLGLILLVALLVTLIIPPLIRALLGRCEHRETFAVLCLHECLLMRHLTLLDV